MAELHQLLIALGLGLLVGMQRERARKRIAGVRTFALITVLGALSAMLAGEGDGWVLGASILALAAMLFLGQMARLQTGRATPGITTEIAALVMFAVGALLGRGFTVLGIAAAGGVAVLLQWKGTLHRLAWNIREEDARAVTRLVLIGLVILPALPNESYGPYDVINPFKIWLMVVLIVGISLSAYVASQVLGARAGTLLGGVLGGLISSTATTVSYARHARDRPETSAIAAVIIVIASTVVFGRVLFEIAVVAPGIFWQAAPPLVWMAVYMALISAVAFFFTRRQTIEVAKHAPPSNLVAAIVFGLLYAVVLFGVAVARRHFGDAGLYTVAFVSGLTDMDAITISSAQMIQAGRVSPETGWRLILVGALSNILFKAVAVAFLGSRQLAGRVAVLFALSMAGGIALIFFWP